MILAFILNFGKITFPKKKISKEKWIFNPMNDLLRP